jgi:hypothetical protein
VKGEDFLPGEALFTSPGDERKVAVKKINRSQNTKRYCIKNHPMYLWITPLLMLKPD